jgi:hypothetical protein
LPNESFWNLPWAWGVPKTTRNNGSGEAKKGANVFVKKIMDLWSMPYPQKLYRGGFYRDCRSRDASNDPPGGWNKTSALFGFHIVF